jgi:tRNA A-37 threonylcarbamoyl transferase component Bud32
MMRTKDELAEFLRNVREGKGPEMPIPDNRAAARYNPLSCTRDQANELAALADRPPPGLSLYKFGSRSIVGSYILSDGTPVVLKYYFPKNLLKHLSYGIAGSRCMQSWIAALAFQFLELPTPAPMAMVESRKLRGCWLEKSFIATRRADGLTLDAWVSSAADDRIRLNAMAAQLQRLFTQMAVLRIAHGDLKSTNLLVDRDDNLAMIDLDACELWVSPTSWPSRRERDRRIFESNWQQQPAIASAFAESFNPVPGS